MFVPTLLKTNLIESRHPVNQSHWLARGLDVWWLPNRHGYGRFEVLDMMANKRPGAFTGFYTIGTPANCGWRSTDRPGGISCIQMNPTSGDVHISAAYDGTSKTDSTVMFWYKPLQSLANAGIWNWSNTPRSANPYILLNVNSLTLQYYVDGNFRDALNTLSLNNWYFVAITNVGTTAWAFYFGTSTTFKQSSTYSGSGAPAGRSTATNVYWGNGFNNPGVGQFDDMRIYNYGMSSQQVQQAWLNSIQGWPRLLNRTFRELGPTHSGGTTYSMSVGAAVRASVAQSLVSQVITSLSQSVGVSDTVSLSVNPMIALSQVAASSGAWSSSAAAAAAQSLAASSVVQQSVIATLLAATALTSAATEGDLLGVMVVAMQEALGVGSLTSYQVGFVQSIAASLNLSASQTLSSQSDVAATIASLTGSGLWTSQQQVLQALDQLGVSATLADQVAGVYLIAVNMAVQAILVDLLTKATAPVDLVRLVLENWSQSCITGETWEGPS